MNGPSSIGLWARWRPRAARKFAKTASGWPSRRAALRISRRRQESARSPVVRRTQSDSPHSPRPRTIPGSHRPRSAAIRPNKTGPPRIPAHRLATRHGAHHTGTVPRALRAFSQRALSRHRSRFALRRSRSRTFVFRALRPGAHAGRPAFVGFSRSFIARKRGHDRRDSRVRTSLAGLGPRALPYPRGRGRAAVRSRGNQPAFARASFGAFDGSAHGVFEFDNVDGRVEKMDAAELGNLESRLTPAPRSGIGAPGRAGKRSARIPALAPMLGDFAGRHARECAAGREGSRVLFSRAGICAVVARRQSASVWAIALKPLTATTAPKLEQLVRQLVLHRSPLASDVKHPLYRAAPERWLETLVLEEPDRLDAQLDPAHLYSQVPALSAGDRGVIDLLGITRRGRLVVIELKASEDIQLPIQALDYWLRVRRHQLSGDFQSLRLFCREGIRSEAAAGLARRSRGCTSILLRRRSCDFFRPRFRSRASA